MVTECKSLHDAIHKEGNAPSSMDKRPAIELAIVKSPVSEGEADCLSKHASRTSEELLQQVNNQAQWRITAERCWRHEEKRGRGQEGFVRK